LAVSGVVHPVTPNEYFRVSVTNDNGRLKVVWSPDLGSERWYTLYGTPVLGGKWAKAPSPDDAAFIASNRFFKVSVSMYAW